MRSAFLDTSGWFAAISPREAQHTATLAAYKEAIESGVQLVTTNLVVAEMQILLMKYRGVAEGVRFLDRLHSDLTHDVVFVDRELERAATDRWLRKFSDAKLSLADAVSFEVMRQRKIKDVLALDEHFAIAGFSTVP